MVVFGLPHLRRLTSRFSLLVGGSLCAVSWPCVAVIEEVGYLELMFSDLYRGSSQRPGFTHAVMLRRGSLVELLRSGTRCSAAELAAEARLRAGLCGNVPRERRSSRQPAGGTRAITSEPRHPHSSGRVVLVGDDGLGVRVLEELHGLDVAVTAVCARDDSPFARAARSAEAPLVVGEPVHEDTLREAGVEGALACGLLIDADLANLHVALELQQLAPQARIVVRLSSTPPSPAPCAVW